MNKLKKIFINLYNYWIALFSACNDNLKRLANHINLILFIMLILPVTIFSHSLWINITDYYPKIHSGKFAFTKFYIGYGHHFPVDDFPLFERFENFSLITPDGTEKKITPGVKDGFLETALKLEKKGTYIISVLKNPGFYTIYLDKKGKMHHKLVAKTEVKVKGKIVTSLYFQQFAKAVICVGNKQDKSFLKPVGHKLEIIPLENPAKLKGCGGHFLPVKILFNGKPAMFKKVFATYSGFSFDADDFAYTTTTDRQGIANIRILSRGQWLIKTEMRLPPAEDKKNKCNEIHYTATLTVGVK